RASIFLVETDGPGTAWVLSSDGPLRREAHLPEMTAGPGDGVVRESAICVADLSAGAGSAHDRWLVDNHGIRSVLALPIVSQGRILGTLLLGSRTPDRYVETDIAVLEPIVESMAVAIENSRLFHQVEASEQRFRSLVQNASDVILVL